MAVFLHPLGKYAHYHHHQLHLSLAQKPKKGFLMSVRALQRQRFSVDYCHSGLDPESPVSMKG